MLRIPGLPERVILFRMNWKSCLAPSSGHYTKEEKDAIYLICIGQLSIIISILKSLFIVIMNTWNL